MNYLSKVLKASGEPETSTNLESYEELSVTWNQYGSSFVSIQSLLRVANKSLRPFGSTITEL